MKYITFYSIIERKNLRGEDLENLFDQPINRENTRSLKWDFTEERFGVKDALPMWVADMDFASPQCIIDALKNRAAHPVYGYTGPSNPLYESIIHWMRKKHDWNIHKSWITFSSGVVSALATCVQALSNPGDKILLQSPVYTPFFHVIKTNDREVVNSQLKLINGRYELDFEDFEEKLKSGVKLFLFCSPHNPGGRIWTKEELTKIGELCTRYNVTMISDEIHADLALPGYQHIPLATLGDFSNRTITCMAPSKTFNIAGIQASIMITENRELRAKITAHQQKQGFHGLNLFALEAMEAAYRDGEAWLNEAVSYIHINTKLAIEYIQKEIPQLKPMKPEASYLLWIDCRDLGLTDQEIQDKLLKEAKLILEPGPKYGPGGEGWVRMNLGCTRTTLMDGLNRLKKAFL